MIDALETAICCSTGVTHISEISGCCFLLEGVRKSFHIVRWVACGGIGAVSDGLGDARGCLLKSSCVAPRVTVETAWLINRYLSVPCKSLAIKWSIDKQYSYLHLFFFIFNVPVNNFSVMLRRATYSWVLPVLFGGSKCLLLKETTHRPGRGSNPGLPIRSPTL